MIDLTQIGNFRFLSLRFHLRRRDSSSVLGCRACRAQQPTVRVRCLQNDFIRHTDLRRKRDARTDEGHRASASAARASHERIPRSQNPKRAVRPSVHPSVRPSACRSVGLGKCTSLMETALQPERTNEGTRSTCHSRRQSRARIVEGRITDWTRVSSVSTVGITKPQIKSRGGREKRARERERGREQSDGNKIPERTDDVGGGGDGYCGHIITPVSRPQTAKNQTHRKTHEEERT